MAAGKLTKQIVFRVDDEMYAALQADAERHGRTVAQSVRFYMRDLQERIDRNDDTGRP